MSISSTAMGLWAIAIGTVGLAAVGVGVGVGIAASNRYDESAAHCIDDYCLEEGLAIREEAINQADIATLVFAVGSVAVAGGIVLVWTAVSTDDAEAVEQDPQSAARLGVRVGPAGASFEGAW